MDSSVLPVFDRAQFRRPPCLGKTVREVIICLGNKNVGWGLQRIVVELKKLALRHGRTTVRRGLVEQGVLLDSKRRVRKYVVMSWRTFVAAPVNTMVACDFYCEKVWTPRRTKWRACWCSSM